MAADLDVAAAQLAGYDRDALFGAGVFDPEQVFGKQFAEAAMDFADAFAAVSRAAA